MTRAMAETPRYRDAPGLPPLSAESKARLEKAKAAKAEKERKKNETANKKTEKNGTKDDGCELM